MGEWIDDELRKRAMFRLRDITIPLHLEEVPQYIEALAERLSQYTRSRKAVSDDVSLVHGQQLEQSVGNTAEKFSFWANRHTSSISQHEFDKHYGLITRP